jgi:hypothetical protein
MSKLNTNANIDNVDDFYQRITDLSLNLKTEEIMVRHAKLILLLSNHIGDNQVLNEAIEIAQDTSRDEQT